MSRPSRNRFASAIETILLSVVPVVAAVMILAAVRANAQAPAAAPAAEPAVPLKLPADRVYAKSVSPDSAVTFSHASHVNYESNRCTGCHPKLYRILGPSPAISHREMNAGGSCGTCHDGKHAFDVRAKESCGSCHAGRRKAAPASSDSAGAAPAGFSGPKPFAFKHSSASPGFVTFRHETHGGKAQLKCGACHSKLFAMKPLAQDPNADYHARTLCGACHDGKQSFGVEDDAACERCHKEGKAGQ
jgi:c(7)-type cytochrome triheme protein